MNRLERFVRIHRILKSTRPVPMRRFTEELGISRTTVTRDFEYLRDFLGAPVIYNREANGHHYNPDTEGFELPGFWLNQSELYARLATEQLLESTQPGLLAPYLGPLKTRVRKLLGQSGQRAETVSKRIRIIAAGCRTTDSDGFGTVAEATLTERKLVFHYHGRARDARTSRTVHPQHLISYRGNWYLVAHCEQAEDIRVFSLDRIHKPAILDAPARHFDEAATDRVIEASYGIFTGSAEGWAILQFTAEAARWAADERWHTDQLGVWKGDVFELQVPNSDPTELIMEILRYGPDVEVLAPDVLRNQVAQRLRRAVEKY
ncbi:MAG: YafY family protein [Aquisalimonadaceae bacterium]